MSKRLTIGIKATQIGPGGGLTHLTQCLKWFPILAPETHFIVYAASGHERHLKTDAENIDFRFYHFPSFGLPARLLWEQTALPEFLSRDKCDLLFEPGNYAIKNPPCPSVPLIHNLAPFIPEYIATETAYQQFRLRLLRYGTISAIASSAGTIFLSQFARNVLRHHVDLSSTRSTVIYHGATDRVSKSMCAREKFILCVSHIYRYKGILELVRAYAQAIAIQPELPKLVIAGHPHDRPYTAQIESVISLAGLGDKVQFLGSVGEEQLQRLYRTCEFFVFPSTIENCPNILIEALAAGCPILSSNCGVMPEICGDAALYCDPSDITSISDSLLELHRNQLLRNSLSDKATARATQFSWRSTAQQTLDFIRQTISKPVTQPEPTEQLATMAGERH
jgi:glycosyltransferase involved in cell wall biosynthesis